jgi:hypothetical protein
LFDTLRRAGASVLLVNNEVDAIILGAEPACQAEALLQRDVVASAPIALASSRHRSIEERLDEFSARLREYWM